ncbi:LOW QUALITY PROTEIN: hypothetical protein QTO34_010047 [Cnephaeus nilssonii]|uniref:Immunoglobulin V-set domain-containing protein n=1 Tax=Cnephaeus nilssonii TaxID=3371016 RepID=A0AA40LFG3_CNENI|nr:LOW QUALITY PROTEIN: hypothetical protein QTO34_010047 [Eptesicus nilssonii]
MVETRTHKDSGADCQGLKPDVRVSAKMSHLLLLLSLRWEGEWAGAEEGGERLKLNVPEINVGLSTVSLEDHAGYELQTPGPVTMQEGLHVLVTCTFSYLQMESLWTHFPSSVSWKGPTYTRILKQTNQKPQKRTLGCFHNLRDPPTNTCSLNIRDARREDGRVYLFLLEREIWEGDVGNRGPVVKFTFKYKTEFLNVTDLTQTPDIQVAALLESGQPGTLICSMPAACNWRKPHTFFWIWDTLISLGPGTAHLSEVTIIL